MSNELKGFDALIAAFQILRKYDTPSYPTGCEHDELRVYVSPEKVSAEDIVALEELGFDVEKWNDCFISHKFGSA